MPRQQLPGGDPDALKMLIAANSILTLMGGIIGTVVPVAEAQHYRSRSRMQRKRTRRSTDRSAIYRTGDGGQGMHLFAVAGFDKRHAQVAAISGRHSPQDFAGMKIRVPPGQMMLDTFAAFGAQPVTTPANKIYESLQNGIVDGRKIRCDPAGVQAL